MTSNRSIQKKNAGYRAAEYVEDEMVLGLGTGSTAKFAIEKIGQRVKKERLCVKGIPTSIETKKRAEEAGIELTDLDEAHKIDLTIDGADEVDPNKDLIKGGGGALLREKVIASNSKKYIVIVDQSKIVDTLGESFDLPVEILPHWVKATMGQVEALGCESKLRLVNNKPYKTDNGNHIIDCDFGEIMEPKELSKQLNMIPGVMENGLFLDMSDIVIIGKEKGFEERD